MHHKALITLVVAGVLMYAQAVAAEPQQSQGSAVAPQLAQPLPGGADGQATAEEQPVTFDFAGLRLTQSRTDDAYLLDIELGDLPADQVLVRPAGGGLLIAVRRTSETSREEVLEDGRGYRRSWGYSSGRRSQRLPAPPDADLRALRRVDEADAIHIRIPRLTGAPGYGRMSPMSPHGRPGTEPAPPSQNEADQ
jgi:hypothetical protein